MALTLKITQAAEKLLRNAFGDSLDRAALEAMTVEGYRTGKLSSYEVQTLLGFEDRWETEAWLGARGVRQNYDIEDLAADRELLRRKLGRA